MVSILDLVSGTGAVTISPNCPVDAIMVVETMALAATGLP